MCVYFLSCSQSWAPVTQGLPHIPRQYSYFMSSQYRMNKQLYKSMYHDHQVIQKYMKRHISLRNLESIQTSFCFFCLNRCCFDMTPVVNKELLSLYNCYFAVWICLSGWWEVIMCKYTDLMISDIVQLYKIMCLFWFLLINCTRKTIDSSKTIRLVYPWFYLN